MTIVVRKALVLSLLQRYVAFIIQFVSGVIMARLLSPGETGIFSLAAAVVGIASMLRDFGVGDYVVQEKDLTHERLRSALGVTVLMAALLAACVYLAAAPLAHMYNEPGIERVLHVLTINFLLLPVGSLTFAVLTREMAFKAMFWVQSTSGLVGAVTGIWLAYNGFSYMSMAWSSLAAIATTVTMLTYLRPRESLIWPSFKGMARVTRVGGVLTLGRLADQASRRLPEFMIASGLGFHAVGINSKVGSLADAFHEFFISGISRVAFPLFAKRIHDQDSGREDYLRGVRLISIAPLFFFGFLTVFADPLVYLLFGPAWLEMVAPLQIVSVAGMAVGPYFLAPPMLIANGQVNDMLLIQVVGAIVMLPMIWYASTISLVAVAIAGVLGTLVKLVLFQRGLYRGFGIRLSELLRAAWPGIVTATAAFVSGAPALLLYERTALSALLSLTIGGTLATGVGCAVLFLIKHPLANEFMGLANKLFPRAAWAARGRVD